MGKAKPKNQRFPLLQNADIFSCYENLISHYNVMKTARKAGES